MRVRVRSAAVLLFLSALFTSCAAEDVEPRDAWLQQTIVTDNRYLIERDPDLSADKFRKMALGPYEYLRGTAGQYARDFSQAGEFNTRSSYGSAESSRTLLMGDAHLENIGSFRASDGTLLLGFSDFDAAFHGPYFFDVRRLVNAWYVAAEVAWSGDPEVSNYRTELMSAAARGYAEQISQLAAGGQPISVRWNAGFGTIVDDLLRRANRDGNIREELLEYTQVSGDTRFIAYDEIEDPVVAWDGQILISDETFPISSSEVAMMRAAVAQYGSTARFYSWTPEQLEIKGISRRIGAGVSSYPILRYYVLVEGPTTSIDDDILLEFKEILDPPRLDGFIQFPYRAFENNAQRGVISQQRFNETPDADPYLGWAHIAPFAFRVRERTKYQKNFGVDRLTEKVAEGEWTIDDAIEFAELSGRLLADGHARAPGLNGEDMLRAIAEAIDGDVDGFTAETVEFGESYGAQVLDDYDRFRSLLEREGPLLGAQRLNLD